MITAWLEQALARGGDRVALTHADRSLTYQGVEERSALVASRLRARGVKPGDRVALHMEKSLDCVLALLGVLRAGAAYVPIDLRLPVTRKIRLREVTRPSLAIDSAKTQAWEWAGDMPTASIESLLEGEMASDSGAALPPLSPALPAYLLFTSGSSGEPKAVEVSQEAAYSFARWAARATGLTEADSIASVTGFHFDLSTYDLFAGLGANAHVVLVPQGVTTFPAQLARLLEQQKITTLYAVPSTISLLAEHGQLAARNLASLRCLIAAGDLFPLAPALRFREATGCRLFNFYGPTETNVCTFFELPATFPPDRVVPIGQPAAGDECRILRESGELAESGKGELLVSGPTLMAGYFRDADANARAFLEAEGKRWYRTGDLVERADEGDFLFVGREDGQVKSWGHRVHPNETELALAALPAVAECAVVALPDPRAGFLLHALVVARAGAAEGAEELQAALRSRLPSHFLPVSLRLVASLPHTANGKVDRRAVREILLNEA